MIEATQMAAVQEAPIKTLHDVPQLLIQWSSPWQEFVTSLRPALRRSTKPLAGEAPTKIFPVRGMLAAWVFESALLAAAIVVPAKIASMQPYVPPPKPTYDVIYFSGDELPQTEDIGGAEKGKSGQAGGHHAQHRTQTIRVVRGNAPVEKVVDAPKVNLPKSDLPVANLLAVNRIPAPPTSGLRSALPTLPQTDPIAPAPSAARDRFQAPPSLASSIVAPPPEVSRDKIQTLPEVATAIVAPPPNISREQMRAIQGPNSSVVAPPPEVVLEKMRTLQGVNTSVIAPPPSIQQEIAGARLPAARNVDVVPPPVSAPVNPNAMASRLSLPQASVVAPPPSNVSRELSSYGTVKAGELRKQQIVPPPAEVAGGVSGSTGARTSLPTNVVPPPPGASGTGSVNSGRYTAAAGTLAANIVPPPPTITSGGSTRHGGSASRAGLGSSLEASSVSAPKAAGGNGATNTAVVISSQPGSRVGVPGSGGAGALAVSPAGGAKAGIGGSGNGGGLGQGNGPGSGLTGEGSGGASSGTGRGSDPASKSGISPYPGTGGAGTTVTSVSNTPGISVSGGNTITLPSFGAGNTGPNSADPSRTRLSKGSPGITIVASSRSGGALPFYGVLKGDPVYTIYFETTLGTAILQYADPSSAHHVYAQELSAPEPMRADLPAGLTPSRMVIACILDQSGVLRNVRVLEAGPAQMSAKVLASLPKWKFKPAFRGDQAVEVNAILGFNIDTSK